jgi:catechol 2,3-dioxygenase-like lactoylglutathione lyase family enzyme
MQAQESLTGIPLTELGQPVAELPVRDVEAARNHYRDKLGFELGWIIPAEGGAGNEIGSVKRGQAAIFLRRRSGDFEPAVHWYYAVDIRATYAELAARGANITDPLEKKPWGLTQFTVEDLDGNVFHFHGD